MDPIEIELLRHRLTAATAEMGAGLKRSGYSTNIKTRLDYSCALFDVNMRTIAQSFGQPIHLGTMAIFVPNILEEYGRENLQPGDVIVCNDGHLGGLHLNDVCVVSPVHWQDEVVGFAATVAHHIDVGGSTNGSIGLAKEIFQEGLQIPPILLANEQTADTDAMKFITKNVRSPVETAGDLRAQIAAVNLGRRRLSELVDRYGHDRFRQGIEGVLDHTERIARAAIRRSIPPNHYEAEGFLDDDGYSDEPVRIHVAIDSAGDTIHYDLSRCDGQRPASINTTRSVSFAACAYTLRALLGDVDIPMNEGFYRSFSVTTVPGTVVHASKPAAIGAGADTGARVLETALSAFGTLLPERVTADSKGTMCNVMFGGVDPRTGEMFSFYEAIAGGYGGRYGLDGIDAVQPHMQNTENSPIEEAEAAYPVSILRYELIPDSEGAGEFRGGTGLRRDYAFEGPVSFSVMADRSKFQPQGIASGGPARASKFYVKTPEGTRELGSKFTIEVDPGDVVSLQLGGGGGYGDAHNRSREAIETDINSGRLSVARARAEYGHTADLDTEDQ